ncbi:glyoxylate/hydroxypyruvate reductase A [Epibacterium ulvae]|uniref:2-hydroxyacid dehydrogenase n=1 Tax=Epibacterium ulvae TaxID=1156985 RepID=UPI001BFCA7C2|nr:glyoxylate/hydroxypyruvate reductase A [Epibacterium ulvae]MBT8155187.1 glyoxylate/hydroxypyruvate reductase A [Epibacterium ulvae]
MIGVAINANLDILDMHGAAFATHAPELTILRPEEVADPQAVEFALTFRPPDDAFTPYPALKAVVSVAAGVDAILSCPSLPKDVPVLRVEDDDQALQMAGFAAFHVLWHHRRMDLHLEDQANEVWNRPISGRSPSERRVGVMGFGLMGRAVAKAIAALGYPTASLSRSLPEQPEPGVEHFVDRDRDAFLARSDILINVLPLTKATHGVMDADLFAALPQGACVVNLGRGEHLDEGALLAALESGQIAGASLDAFENEPLAEGHPFWSHPRVLVTPHTASAPESKGVVLSIKDGLRRLSDGDIGDDRLSRGY